MSTAAECLAHAAECRRLAAATDPGEVRDQLLTLAAHWEFMAVERDRTVVGRTPTAGALATRGKAE